MTGIPAICEECGKLFRKFNREICSDCLEKEYELLDEVKVFLTKKKNKGASFEDLQNKTGITQDKLVNFVKNGSIALPEDMDITYPCYKCKKPIKLGHLCTQCSNEIKQEVEKSITKKETKKNTPTNQITYFTKDDKKNKR